MNNKKSLQMQYGETRNSGWFGSHSPSFALKGRRGWVKPGPATSSCHTQPDSLAAPLPFTPGPGNVTLQLSLLHQSLPAAEWGAAAAQRRAKGRGEGGEAREGGKRETPVEVRGWGTVSSWSSTNNPSR